MSTTLAEKPVHLEELTLADLPVLKLQAGTLHSSNSAAQDPLDRPQDKEAVLAQISPLFDVRSTVYGGRGCFATNKISKGTSVLCVDRPVGSAVAVPFKKEVCMWCFHYNGGKTMKFRIEGKLYFCLETCHADFLHFDPDGVLAQALCSAEDAFQKCKTLDLPDIVESPHSDAQRWRAVEDWEQKVFRLKPGQRQKHFPKLTAEDFGEAKYVLSTVFFMYRSEQTEGAIPKFLEESLAAEKLQAELQLFDLLQLSELEKTQRYPYLVESYINIYKFIRLVSPPPLVPYISPAAVRTIIGRNLTNAFGVWSPTTHADEGREFFGFAVYPSASYFNHLCEPNVTKQRRGASYTFTASRDIEEGEEMCISYGIDGIEPVAERRRTLSEWFFECMCTRCVRESA